MTLRCWGHFRSPQIKTWLPTRWHNLQFSNPLGTAGGLDKNGTLVRGAWAIGAGFVEIGTVTPEPQAANPGKKFDREASTLSVWNRLGFPNDGADLVFDRLAKLPRPCPTPIFLNIGKNRWTDLLHAHEDYVRLARKFRDQADALVINVSSPNTAGLRELLGPNRLRDFLQPILENSNKTPMLLKLSPDLSNDDLIQVLDTSSEIGISGWVLTNTTLARPGNLSARYPVDGGLSGRPLAARSLEMLKITTEHLKTRGEKAGDKLIISVGGAMTVDDVFLRLRLGAQLVQIYSALVFNGPGFFHEVARYAQKTEMVTGRRRDHSP